MSAVFRRSRCLSSPVWLLKVIRADPRATSAGIRKLTCPGVTKNPPRPLFSAQSKIDIVMPPNVDTGPLFGATSVVTASVAAKALVSMPGASAPASKLAAFKMTGDAGFGNLLKIAARSPRTGMSGK